MMLPPSQKQTDFVTAQTILVPQFIILQTLHHPMLVSLLYQVLPPRQIVLRPGGHFMPLMVLLLLLLVQIRFMIFQKPEQKLYWMPLKHYEKRTPEMPHLYLEL